MAKQPDQTDPPSEPGPDQYAASLDHKGRTILSTVHFKQPLPIALGASSPCVFVSKPLTKDEERNDAYPNVLTMTIDYRFREIVIHHKKLGPVRIPVENVLWYKAMPWKKFVSPDK